MAAGDKLDQQITDLEEIVRKWAWQGFELTKTRDQARIPKEFLHMNINWKYVQFTFEHPEYSISPMRDNKGKSVSPQILFKTIFSNRTNQEQEYSFKTERCTRSTCTVCFERGFTTGMDFSLKMATPCEVVEANAGFKREMTVTNISEDTVEEELVWGVDSQVRVPAHTETTAELVITEAQCAGTFTMRSKFSGRVIVTLMNMKENNSLVTVIEGDMAEIILREIEKGVKGLRVERNRTVVADVKGKCHFKYGIEQRVKIVETPLQPLD